MMRMWPGSKIWEQGSGDVTIVSRKQLVTNARDFQLDRGLPDNRQDGYHSLRVHVGIPSTDLERPT
jgi:hypothetical protein